MPPTQSSQLAQVKDFWHWKSVRFQTALLLSIAMAIHGLIRGNLGMALVCMVGGSSGDADDGSTDPNNSRAHNYTSESESEHNTDLQVDWNPHEISFMHTSFYIGTFLGTFTGCQAQPGVRAVGTKWVIAYGLVIASLCSWAIPVAVYLAPHLILPTATLRFLTGICGGMFIPSASTMIAKWFAPEEMSTAMALFTAGNQVGLGSAMFLTAASCKLNFLGGWPTSFLAYGVLGWLFFLLWAPFASNRPTECKRISSYELVHVDRIGKRSRAATMILTPPYKKIFFSPAVISLTFCSFCQSYVYVAMIAYLPEFFHSMVGMSISANGLWSAMPFLVQILSKLAFGMIADWSKKRGADPNTVTKTFNAIASFGCALCFLLVSFVRATDSPLLLLLICAGLLLTSGYVPGYNTALVSVAPGFTTIISAYCQVFAQAGGMLAPLVIGTLTQKADVEAWGLVFQSVVALCIFSGLVFQIFGSTYIQPWATTVRNADRVKDLGEHGMLTVEKTAETQL